MARTLEEMETERAKIKIEKADYLQARMREDRQAAKAKRIAAQPLDTQARWVRLYKVPEYRADLEARGRRPFNASLEALERKYLPAPKGD